MATYSVTNKYLIDDYAVLQLLTPTELEVGQSITVAAVDATFNGTYIVRALLRNPNSDPDMQHGSRPRILRTG
jgi:hypothetical protein